MNIRLWLLALLVLIVATLLVQSVPKGGRGGGGRGGSKKEPEPETEPEPVSEGEVEETKGKGKGKKDLNEVRERLKQKGPKNSKVRPEGFGKPSKKKLTKEEKDKIKVFYIIFCA